MLQTERSPSHFETSLSQESTLLFTGIDVFIHQAYEKFGVISSPTNPHGRALLVLGLPARVWRHRASATGIRKAGMEIEGWDSLRRVPSFFTSSTYGRAVAKIVFENTGVRYAACWTFPPSSLSEEGEGLVQFDSDYSVEDDASPFFFFSIFWATKPDSEPPRGVAWKLAFSRPTQRRSSSTMCVRVSSSIGTWLISLASALSIITKLPPTHSDKLQGLRLKNSYNYQTSASPSPVFPTSCSSFPSVLCSSTLSSPISFRKIDFTISIILIVA